MKNDSILNRKKFLNIPNYGQMKINPIIQKEYILNLDKFIDRFKKK